MTTTSIFTNIYELTPVRDSHKSFYGKARVWVIGNTKILYSYNTPVAIIEGGEIVKNDLHVYSRTTDRHIRDFIYQELGLYI